MSILIDIIGNAKKLKGPVTSAKRQLGGLGEKSDQVAEQMERSFSRMKVGLAAVGAGLGAVGVSAVKDFGEADDAVREVATLLGDVSEEQISKLHEEVREIADAYGQAGTDVAKAFYDSISAGIADADTVKDFVAQAAEFSTAGATEIGAGVDILTSALNAYGMGSEDAGRVSDIFFSTVKAGKTTVDEMASAFATIGPTAAAAGVSLEEALGWMAQLTLSGTSTAVAANQVKTSIVNLSKPSRKIAKEFKAISGKSFLDFIKQGGTVAEATALLEQRSKDTGEEFVNMTNSTEVMNALLGVTGEKAEGFSDVLGAMAGGAGATTTAFSTMADSTGFQLRQMDQQFQSIKLTVGETLLPVLQMFGDWFAENREAITSALTGMAEFGADVLSSAFELLKMTIDGISTAAETLKGWLEDLFKPIQPLINKIDAADLAGKALAITFGAIIAVKVASTIGTMTTAVGLLWAKLLTLNTTMIATKLGLIALKVAAGFSALLNTFKVAWIGLNLAMLANPAVAIGVAIAGLGAAVYLAYTKFKPFRDIVNAVFGFLKDNWEIIGIVALALTGPLGLIPAIFLAWRRFSAFRNILKAVYSWVKDKLIGAFNLWRQGLQLYLNLLWTVIGVLKNGFQIALDFAKDKIDAMVEFFMGLPERLAGLGKLIMNAIISAMNAGIQMINDFLPDKIVIPFAPDIDLPDNPIPLIPYLAKGGVVTKPTLAVIGEAGPEAVIPLKRGQGGMLESKVEIHIHGDVYGDDQALAERVLVALDERSRVGGPLRLEIA